MHEHTHYRQYCNVFLRGFRSALTLDPTTLRRQSDGSTLTIELTFEWPRTAMLVIFFEQVLEFFENSPGRGFEMRLETMLHPLSADGNRQETHPHCNAHLPLWHVFKIHLVLLGVILC